MEENETEVIDSTIDTETTENKEVETAEVAEDFDSLPEWAQKKIQTTEAQKDHWRDKANKKEDAPKEVEKKDETNKVESQETLSEKDMYALLKSDVPEEDVDEVKAYAKYRKISVPEAIKDKTLLSILSDKAEVRRSAEVSNTKSARGTSKVSGENLLEQAEQGKLPEKAEDINKLVQARLAKKMNKDE